MVNVTDTTTIHTPGLCFLRKVFRQLSIALCILVRLGARLGRFNGCLVSSAVSYEVHIQGFKQHRMDNLARKEQVEFDNKAA